METDSMRHKVDTKSICENIDNNADVSSIDFSQESQVTLQL